VIRPVQQHEALLDDIEAAGRETDPDVAQVWWLGQSGFLMSWCGHRLLFDPYLSDSLTRKYADTDKPHVRMTELAVLPGMLRDIEVTTSTHNHTDHLDAETLLPLRDACPGLQLVLPEANRAFAVDRLGCAADWPTGIDAGESASVGPFEIIGVPAAHEELDVDANGRHLYLGYVVRAGDWVIYHSGDTLRYDGMVERLKEAGPIDIGLLPINGRRPERRVAGNLSGEEAAALAHEAGMGTVIPCHYEMFEFNTADPGEFVRACRRLGQDHRVLQCGEGARFLHPGGQA
jgi:L-ascorbate metabolism protein UlaG (beta-lactamase superfamily)